MTKTDPNPPPGLLSAWFDRTSQTGWIRWSGPVAIIPGLTAGIVVDVAGEDRYMTEDLLYLINNCTVGFRLSARGPFAIETRAQYTDPGGVHAIRDAATWDPLAPAIVVPPAFTYL